MNRILFFISLVLLLSIGCFAQGENNIWYFGHNAGLDFNSGSPVALKGGKIYTLGNSASISNAKGQLLFYTDGSSIWNKNHQLMLQGTDPTGSTSGWRSTYIVPKPKSSSIYYVFTTYADSISSNGFYYSEIDMALNNGLGGVTANKNIVLITPAAEKVAAIENATCDGYWVVARGFEENSFYAYSITEFGINQTPVISHAGTNSSPIGNLRFSPDGKKLVNCGPVTELFDFDLSSGLVSNAQPLYNGSVYGAEFSPSGNVLYLSYPSQLLQFDLLASDIPNSKTIIHKNEPGVQDFLGGGIQLGPDGKIYLSAMTKHFVSAINNPDVVGAGCDFVYNSVWFETGSSGAGLTQFMQSFFNVVINTQENCFGDPFVFSLKGNRTIDSAVWDFGDGTTSNEINPIHQYSKPGKYTVTVKAASMCKTATQSKTVIVSQIPVIPNAVPTQSVCFSEDSPNDLSQFNSLLLGSQSADDFNITYHSTQSEADLKQNAITNISALANIENPQTVYVRIENKLSPICFATTNLQLIVKQKPVLAMDDIYSICEGESVKITAPSGFANYQWSNGAIGNETIINKAGNYSLTVTNGGISCDDTKEFVVYNSNAATITKIGIKDWTDSENSIAIQASGDGLYEYSIDGINYQDSPVFTDLPSGSYTVFVNDKKGCGVKTAEVYLLMYPKFFTPNGDGTNDSWKIKFSSYEPQLKVFIYDRYGKLLKQLINADDSWDGRFNGNDIPSDDYWFVVTRAEGKEYKGHFSLKR